MRRRYTGRQILVSLLGLLMLLPLIALGHVIAWTGRNADTVVLPPMLWLRRWLDREGL